MWRKMTINFSFFAYSWVSELIVWRRNVGFLNAGSFMWFFFLFYRKITFCRKFLFLCCLLAPSFMDLLMLLCGMHFYGDPLNEKRIIKPNEQISKSGLIAMVFTLIYSWDIPEKERQTCMPVWSINYYFRNE